MYRPSVTHTASVGSKSSLTYQSIPIDPNATHYQPAPPVDESDLPCRRKSKSLQVLGITLTLLFSLVLPLALWCWYVFIKERTVFDWKNLAVLTTTNATRFLLLSTISTTVTKAIVGPLMALYAYTAAADWLRSCQREQLTRLPTPTQFGSLLTLFQGTSFIGLFSTLRGGLKKGHVPWPPVLKRVAAVLSWLLFVAYATAMTLVSVWLQIDAEPVRIVPTNTDFPSLGYTSQNALFARTINQTLCAAEDQRQRTKSLARTPACGLVEYLFDAEVAGYTASRGMEVLTNHSDVSRAAWLDDNTAILAPSTPPTVGYRAKALGVRATCKSVTDLCVKCNSTVRDIPLKSARIKVLGLKTGPISPTNGTDIDRYFDANPFSYGSVIRSEGYMNGSLLGDGFDYFAGTTGLLVHGRMGAFNVLYCDVAVYDVAYQFSPPETYIMTSSVLSNVTSANYVAFGMTAWVRGIHSTATRGFDFIDGAGKRGNATYPEIYARQLSKIGISNLDRIIQPTPSDMLLAGSGTRVNLVAMILLFVLNACIIITTISIGTHAGMTILKTDSRFLSAARGRLISAYQLIGDVFGGLAYDYQHHTHAVSAGMGGKAFLLESEADRLQLRPEDVDGGSQGKTVRLRATRI